MHAAIRHASSLQLTTHMGRQPPAHNAAWQVQASAYSQQSAQNMHRLCMAGLRPTEAASTVCRALHVWRPPGTFW